MMLGKHKYVETCKVIQSTVSLPGLTLLKRKLFLPNSFIPKIFIFASKMTTRSQKRKAIAESTSVSLETSLTENNQVENLVAGPSKISRIHCENLDEIKSSLRKQIMSHLTRILAENQ